MLYLLSTIILYCGEYSIVLALCQEGVLNFAIVNFNIGIMDFDRDLWMFEIVVGKSGAFWSKVFLVVVLDGVCG